VTYYDDPVSGITIYHGNCYDVLPTVIDRLAGLDEQVRLVLTDPPYSEQTHEGAQTLAGGNGPTELIDFPPITYTDLLQLLDLLHDSTIWGWFVSTLDFRYTGQLADDMTDLSLRGWEFMRAGVWVKEGAAPQFTGHCPGMGWESVAVLRRKGYTTRWRGGGHHAVWTHPIVRGGYPTEKPVGLYRKWLEQFTEPGDLILDPFMGSGTSLRAAKDMGRRAIGIELSSAACAIAVEKLRQGVLL